MKLVIRDKKGCLVIEGIPQLTLTNFRESFTIKEVFDQFYVSDGLQLFDVRICHQCGRLFYNTGTVGKFCCFKCFTDFRRQKGKLQF